MSTYRITAIEDVLERAPKALETPSRKISEYYGDNAFTLSAMREYLTEEAYDHVVAATRTASASTARLPTRWPAP